MAQPPQPVATGREWRSDSARAFGRPLHLPALTCPSHTSAANGSLKLRELHIRHEAWRCDSAAGIIESGRALLAWCAPTGGVLRERTTQEGMVCSQ